MTRGQVSAHSLKMVVVVVVGVVVAAVAVAVAGAIVVVVAAAFSFFASPSVDHGSSSCPCKHPEHGLGPAHLLVALEATSQVS